MTNREQNDAHSLSLKFRGPCSPKSPLPFISCLLEPENPNVSNRNLRAYEVADQVKVLAAEPDHMSSIPGTHMVQGEKQLPRVCMYISVCVCVNVKNVKPISLLNTNMLTTVVLQIQNNHPDDFSSHQHLMGRNMAGGTKEGP